MRFSRTAAPGGMVALVIGGLPIPGSANEQISGLSPNTKACRPPSNCGTRGALRRQGELPRGMDGDALSTCTVTLGAHGVKLQVSPPGTPGVPSSIEMGLNGVKMLASAPKSMVQVVETKDFGTVGCSTTKASIAMGKEPATSMFSTACFVVQRRIPHPHADRRRSQTRQLRCRQVARRAGRREEEISGERASR